MKVYAISDLHIDFAENRRALNTISDHPHDWLIIAGDISHREEDLEFVLKTLTPRFRQLIWVPGNHDLWTLPQDKMELKGEKKYHQLVSICKTYKVFTPEDPYVSLPWRNQTYTFAPLFLLYDYSFRPDHIESNQAVQWALEKDILSADECYLSPEPYPSFAAWCEKRCQLTEERLASVPSHHSLILINHFPLRRDLIRILIKPFIIWCGTRRTEDWHTRYNVAIVITGHLHVRSTDWRGLVRFEEVSLGYPRHWRRECGLEGYLRQILPADNAEEY